MSEVLNVESDEWDLVIRPRDSILKLNLKEVWRFRYLLVMFVKRDIVSMYKQTILGPLWFFIQPILTTIVFVVIFGNIAKISTDGLPQVLILSGRNYRLELFFRYTHCNKQYFCNQCKYIRESIFSQIDISAFKGHFRAY